MIVIKGQEVAHIYNRKDEKLIIVFLDDSRSIYTVGGWFGKKLNEFLTGDGDVESFLEKVTFKSNAELGGIFKRLLATLIREGVLCPQGDGLALVKPGVTSL